MVRRYIKFAAVVSIIILPYFIEMYWNRIFSHPLNWMLLWQCAMICLMYNENECMEYERMLNDE